MKGYNYFLIASLSLLILMIYPGVEYSISFGWHTEILTEKSIITIIGLALILGITIVYWTLNRETIKTNKILTICHILMTIIPIFWILFSSKLIFSFVDKGINKMVFWAGILAESISISILVLLLGQLLFTINIILGIRKALITVD